MRRRTLQFMYFVLGATVLLLVSIGFFAFRSLENLIEESNLVEHTSHVLFQSEQVISILRETESSQRGFIITHDSCFLGSYLETSEQVLPQIGTMDSLLNISPQSMQRERLKRLNHFVIIRLASLRQSLSVASEPPSADQQLRLMARLERGRATMDSVLILLDSMENTEKILLTERVYQKKLLSGDTLGLLTLISMLAIGLFSLAFYSVIQEVIRRQRYEQELKKTVEDLWRSNQDLEQFAYVTSHHFQEPMRKLQTFGNRLMQKYGEALSADTGFLVERMNDLAGQMQLLLDDLLIYTGVGARVNVTSFETLDLSKVFQRVIDTHQRQIGEAGAIIQLDAQPCNIRGNSAQLELLFSQLLQNSLKFVQQNRSPVISIHTFAVPGKEILGSVQEESKKEFVKIVFSDNGIGIESKYYDKVFELFQRLHPKDYPGTGAGLAICKQIVRHHNGYILLSESKIGTTFNLYLPI
ncbi:MAG: CHASE3 domain-containing protein [Phycisphaerae bacterium]|nr:CHASE3 domain-containing protein [Saprospiraceae bacterium]